MKIFLFVLSLFTLCPYLFAGAFFSNALVQNIGVEAIGKFLKSKGYASFVVVDSADSNLVLVATSVLDQGPTEYARFLTELTVEFKTRAVACFVADSDVLYLCVFDQGKKIFEYTSLPDWGWQPAFGGEKPSNEPEMTGLENLLSIYKCDKKELIEFTKKSKVNSYAFAEELQADIYKLLGFPQWVIGIGYANLKEGTLPISDLTESGKKVIEVQ